MGINNKNKNKQNNKNLKNKKDLINLEQEQQIQQPQHIENNEDNNINININNELNNNNNNNNNNKNKNIKFKNKVVKFKIDDQNSTINHDSSNDESEAILKRVKETLKHEDQVEIIGTSDQIISTTNNSQSNLIRSNSGNNINEIISGGELSSEDEEHLEFHSPVILNNDKEGEEEIEVEEEEEEEDIIRNNHEDDEILNYNNTSNDEKEINEEEEEIEKEKILQKYKLKKSSNRVLITNALKNSMIDNDSYDNNNNNINNSNDINNSNNEVEENINSKNNDKEVLNKFDISSGGEYSSSTNSPMPTLKLSYDEKTTISKRELGQHVDGKDVANVVSESLNLESNNKQSSNKILEKKKSLDNLELNPFLKSLSEKRNNFIKKIIQKVWSTLKQASSDDLSTSQKDRIIQEVFKDISLELDEPVFEYLTTLSDKDIEKVNNNLNNPPQQQQLNNGNDKQQSPSTSPPTKPNSNNNFNIPTFKNSSKKDGILNNYYPYPCLDVAAKRLKLTTYLSFSSSSINQTSSSPINLNNSNSGAGGKGVGLIHSSSNSNISGNKGILNSSSSSVGSNSGVSSGGSSGNNSSMIGGGEQQKEIYYYQLISQYFLNNPDKVELFRPLLQTLWTNNQWFYLIYSSMFFSWLLEYRLSLTPQLNIFIKASNRLFWYDCDHYTKKYYQVYATIKQKLMDRSLWNGLCEASKAEESNDPDIMRSNLLRNRRIWIDFYHIVSVFYFYYEKPNNESLDEFRYNINRQYQDFILDTIQKKHLASDNIKENNEESTTYSSNMSNTKDLVLSIDDLFVRGILKHLNLIKHEETLIGYIDRCLVFKENWDLNPTTKVKLQSCLYALTKPGSPSYVPRSVRTKSRAVLDQLFPEGKFSRHTVNLFFRLLHPYYSIGSILHWGFNLIKPYIPFISKNNNNNGLNKLPNK